MIVYMLDISSYDARGGTGRPFATLEGAKAAAGADVEWREGVDNNGDPYWYEEMGQNSVRDNWIIDTHPLGP